MTAERVPGHVVAAFGFARGLWPTAREASSEATQIAWAPHLAKYSWEELCAAFDRLALHGGFPKLAELVAVLKDMCPKPVQTPRLAGSSRPIEEVWREEARNFCRDRSDGVEHLAKLNANIDAACDGPFTRRIRGIFDGSDKRSTAEFLRTAFTAPDERTGRAISVGEALGGPRETPEQLAVKLCDRQERGEQIDSAALDPEVRAAARAEWIRRRKGVPA